jgi:hypothetical protein
VRVRLLDLPCHVEILLSDSASRVRAQRAHDFGVPNVNVRMMIRPVSRLGDRGNEVDSVEKLPELVGLRDGVAPPTPTRKSPKFSLYRNIRKTLSHRFAPDTSLRKNIASLRLPRLRAACLGVVAMAASPTIAHAQTSMSAAPANHYWRNLAMGFGTSILAHETAHVLTAYAVGAHPHFGFDRGRPTIFSGIDTGREPRKQFLFSAAGLTTQALIDELILDVPHSRGSAFERGILAGGIGTTLFYITLGRNASVSDVSFMARTSSLSKTQISLIFGGISALHAIRIARDSSYAHFFVRPTANGAALAYEF